MKSALILPISLAVAEQLRALARRFRMQRRARSRERVGHRALIDLATLRPRFDHTAVERLDSASSSSGARCGRSGSGRAWHVGCTAEVSRPVRDCRRR